MEGRAELAAVRAYTRRSLAAMRWKHATAVIGSRTQMSVVRLPTLASYVPSAMPVLQEARFTTLTSWSMGLVWRLQQWHAPVCSLRVT